MNGRCKKCGTYRESLHRDHIIPKWAGGSDDLDNLQYLCANCHEDKTIAERRSHEYKVRSRRSESSTSRAFSVEHRKKLRQSQLGKPNSEESKDKLRRYRIGKVQSKETREKISKSMRASYRRRALASESSIVKKGM